MACTGVADLGVLAMKSQPRRPGDADGALRLGKIGRRLAACDLFVRRATA